MKTRGYTLVELIVVFALVVVVGTAGARLFGSIFKSTAKADHISQVKHEGDYAMETMARSIRNAQAISAATVCTSDGSVATDEIVIVNPDGTETSYAVASFAAGHLYIASDSARLTSSKVNVYSSGAQEKNIFVCTSNLGRPATVDIGFTAVYYDETSGNEVGTELNFVNKFSLRTY